MSEQLAADQVIDLAQLRRMTLGVAALEREVLLSLFSAHSALLLEKMRSDPAAVPALAHTLKGSALGTGATELARAADDLQHAGPMDQAAILRLDRAVEEARLAIAGMLARSGD